jgi:hypothetical protein
VTGNGVGIVSGANGGNVFGMEAMDSQDVYMVLFKVASIFMVERLHG